MRDRLVAVVYYALVGLVPTYWLIESVGRQFGTMAALVAIVVGASAGVCAGYVFGLAPQEATAAALVVLLSVPVGRVAAISMLAGDQFTTGGLEGAIALSVGYVLAGVVTAVLRVRRPGWFGAEANTA